MASSSRDSSSRIAYYRTTGYEDVYPHEVHPLLQEHTRHPDADSIRSALSQIYSLKITDENRQEFQKELTSMTELSSKLNHEIEVSYTERKHLSQEQGFLCIELAKKVPGIPKMPIFSGLSACQKKMITTFLDQKKRREVVASYNPQARVLQALLVSFNAEQLAQILKVPVDLTEKLKNKLPKTFDDPPEPAQLPKSLTATMVPLEPAQPERRDCQLKDIQGVLQVISLNITMHRERISSCLKLLEIVSHYIEALRLCFENLEEPVVVTSEFGEQEAVEQNLSWDSRLFVDNLPFTIDVSEVVALLQTVGNVQIVRFFYDNLTLRSSGFGFVTMSSAEEAQAATQKLNGLIIGDRTIRVNYGPPPLEERFEFGGSRGGGGCSDTYKRLYVRNLPFNVDDTALGSLFSKQGKVLEARVMHDTKTGRSRGFGFVTYGSTEDFKNALSSLNGAVVYGRRIGVSMAKEGRTKALLSIEQDLYDRRFSVAKDRQTKELLNGTGPVWQTILHS
ncbi:hypothetical protein C5167_021721 [Papaver somniferum]|uniref:RRM domain-containing protein n=1 Tax=Papaver somniferum TaxID=3469 RepID=A0A4Y7JIT3_PAPSO|nr:uncharacterized protein LOC113280861 [Papaver somniferum]RZC59960.1 hypothetical protein C5167_021721 [Papaver somniferum]